MKHRKRSLAFLLAMLMILSPVSAFAQTMELPKAETEVTASAVEAPALPEEKAEEPEAPQEVVAPVEEPKTQAEPEVPVEEQKAQAEPEAPVEEKSAPQETEQETPEEPAEAPAEEQVAKEPVKETPQAVEALAEEETTDDNELEIDDTFRPEDNAVRGGGSSGGGPGGGSSGGGGFSPTMEFLNLNPLIIEKKDNHGKPMSVVFKITNMQSNQSHLVVTDAETGLSGNIFPLPLTLTGPFGKYFTGTLPPGAPITDLITEDDLEQPDDPPLSLFLGLPTPQPPVDEPPTPIEPPKNPNDQYLNDPEGLYDAKNLDPKVPVHFNPPAGQPRRKINLDLMIYYGKKDGVDFDSPESKALRKDPNSYQTTEVYTYEDVQGFDLMQSVFNFTVMDTPLNRFIDQRLAVYKKYNKIDNSYMYVGIRYYIDPEDAPESEVYKFEEQRTENNVGYALKTFYIKNTPSGKYYYGDTEEECNNATTPLEPSVRENQQQGPPIVKIAVENSPIVFETVATSDGNPVVESESEKGLPSNKFVEQGDKTKVVDKITYDKLSVGKSYKFVGKLINKRTGETVETSGIVRETGKLTSPKGEADITFTFDSTTFKEGDEFVILYEIYENGLLAGGEDKIDNEAQSFTLKGKTTPPPKEDEPKDPPKPEEPPTPEEPPKPEEPPTPEEPPKPEVPHVHVPIKVSMPPVRIPTAGVGR